MTTRSVMGSRAAQAMRQRVAEFATQLRSIPEFTSVSDDISDLMITKAPCSRFFFPDSRK
jgi:hypothetical protein